MPPTKPTALHLVEGTVNVTRHRNRKEEPKPTGKPEKPPFLKGKAAKLWDQYVEIGYWLTNADSYVLALWCGLTAEAEKDLKNMTASRISQWRALSSELGFGPASRTRINAGNNKETKKPEDQFYS